VTPHRSLRPAARPVAVALLVALVLVLLVLADSDARSAPTAPDAPVPAGPDVLAAVAGPVAPGSVLREVTARRSRSAVDTSSRAAVQRAYRRQMQPLLRSEPAIVPDGCRYAATPTATQLRTIRAVNYARRMAGLDPVTLDASLSRRAQRAALIQHHLGYLTHTPSVAAPCFSAVGALAAGRSNLAYKYEGAATVLAYLEDRGSSNRAAGHRRWLLAPTTEAMGTGQVGEYNALYVVPPSRQRSERNANPTWIAWPAAGWFPAEMQPGGRWSFGAARPGLGLGKATVRVTVGGKAVPLRLYRPHPGYGEQATLVWDLKAPIAVPRGGVRAATVTVRGMTLRGKPLPPRRYTVRLFWAG